MKLYGNDAPLFPTTNIAVGDDGLFQLDGLKPEPWRSAGPIRRIFKEAFERAGLPYFKPHSVRHALVELGEKICRSPEEFKAWSQNLGHEGVMTTFNSHGTVSHRRQREVIARLGDPIGPETPVDVEVLAEAVARRLKART